MTSSIFTTILSNVRKSVFSKSISITSRTFGNVGGVSATGARFIFQQHVNSQVRHTLSATHQPWIRACNTSRVLTGNPVSALKCCNERTSTSLLTRAVASQFNTCQSRHLSSSPPSLSTSTPPTKGIQSNISSLQAKKRAVRKRVTKPDGEPVASLNNGGILFNQDSSTVIAYATAEEYNLEELSRALQKQGLYQLGSMPEDVRDVLHVTAKYQVGREPREVYFFREGSVVFWNVPDLERESVNKFLQAFEENSYNSNLIEAENEVIEYTYTDNKTRLINGRILLNSEGSTDLEKYTFSNAMALSVKLGLWEASLDRYVDSIEFVTEDMKSGKKITMTRQMVLQKMGELFALRHLINLSSDLLDTPDFYWDRETLESLYHKTCNHLNIPKRTKVMNEKLSHCSELIQLLSDHLNDRHHVRLEVMIIALIMVEVLFEIIHLIGKLS